MKEIFAFCFQWILFDPLSSSHLVFLWLGSASKMKTRCFTKGLLLKLLPFPLMFAFCCYLKYIWVNSIFLFDRHTPKKIENWTDSVGFIQAFFSLLSHPLLYIDIKYWWRLNESIHIFFINVVKKYYEIRVKEEKAKIDWSIFNFIGHSYMWRLILENYEGIKFLKINLLKFI